MLVSCNNDSNSTKDSIQNDSTKNKIETFNENDLETKKIKKHQRDYQEFYPNGTVKIEGNYNENEKRNGLWVSYYDNGVKWSETHYTNGLKNGHTISFFPNGKPRYIGEYQDDKQTGDWFFYNETGVQIDSIRY